MALTVPLYHVDDTCNDSDTYSVWCSVRATCNIIRTMAINARVEITRTRDSDPRMCDARARARGGERGLVRLSPHLTASNEVCYSSFYYAFVKCYF